VTEALRIRPSDNMTATMADTPLEHAGIWAEGLRKAGFPE